VTQECDRRSRRTTPPSANAGFAVEPGKCGHGGRDPHELSASEPIVAALRDRGVAVSVDTTSIEPTAEWRTEIDRAIEASDATIAFLGEAFLTST
jgi:hypothetical protein